MKLNVLINGKLYSDYLVQGSTFTDNFNEALDSGVIALDQIPELKDLEPYDDVFIWNANENFNGYTNLGDYAQINCSDNSIVVPPEQATIIDVDVASQLNATIENGNLVLSGIPIDIWADYFYKYDSITARNCRTDNVVINLAFNVYKYITNTETYFIHFNIVGTRGSLLSTIQLVSITEGVTLECTYDPTTQSILIPTLQYPESYPDGLSILSLKTESTGFVVKRKSNFNVTFDTSLSNVDLNSKLNSMIIKYKKNGSWSEMSLVETEIVSNQLKCHFKLGNEAYTKGNAFLLFSQTGNNLTASFDNTSNLGSSLWNVVVDEITIEKCTKEITRTSEITVLPSFYKHLLVDSFSEDYVFLGNIPNNENRLYKYTINLMSETKRLEKIPLPNISVTQSLNQTKKRTCWFYLKKYVDLYSPKYKKVSNILTKEWSYTPKFAMSEYYNQTLEIQKPYLKTNLKEIFDNVYCPEFTLTNPSLKDLISKIMIVKDMIPVVINDVIYGMDISKTYGTFQRQETINGIKYNPINFTRGSMNSSNYVTDARREYSGALSQEKSTRFVEYMGFRTDNSPFLTFDSMYVKTRFPIYKINKMVMCYYKKFELRPSSGSSVYRNVLIKRDITPLVLQNVVRNSLSMNYESWNEDTSTEESWSITKSGLHSHGIDSISDMAKYKLATVGYDIGSNAITGWGTTYSYLQFLWFQTTKSYIENMIDVIEIVERYGSATYKEIYGDYDPNVYKLYPPDFGINGIVPYADDNNDTQKYKSVFFEIDYDGMYSGAVIHDKPNTTKDDIITVDNCSTAFPVLEIDGLYEREVMERMGNKVYKATGRYDNDNGGANPLRVQGLGTIDNQIIDGYKIGKDGIVSSREYSIYDNVVLANYELVPEYVLKNYFTTIWAKYRTYSLMSYGESVKRTENYRNLLSFSFSNQYYENEDLLSGNLDTSSSFLNFLNPSVLTESKMIDTSKTITGGYYSFPAGSINNNYDYGGDFLSDINVFATGTSLCFNIAMEDNISGGNYITHLGTDYKWIGSVNDYKTAQDWYSTVPDKEDAFVENVGIYVCHLDYSNLFIEKGKDTTNSSNTNSSTATVDTTLALGTSFALPKMPNGAIKTYIIGKEFEIYKDNKERLDTTFQFDYISNDNNILFSPWIAKLNDLVGIYNKFDENKDINEIYKEPVAVTDDNYLTSYIYSKQINSSVKNGAVIKFKIPHNLLGNFSQNEGSTYLNNGNNFSGWYFKNNISTQGITSFYYEGRTGSFEIVDSPTCKFEYNGGTLVSGDNTYIKLSVKFTGYIYMVQYVVGFIEINANYKGNNPIRDDIITLYYTHDDGDNYWFECEYNDDNLGTQDECILKIPEQYQRGNSIYWGNNKIGSSSRSSLNENNSNVAYIVPSVVKGYTTASKNMFVVTSTAPLHKNLVYNEYVYDNSGTGGAVIKNEFPQGYTVEKEMNIQNMFFVENNKIKVFASTFGVPATPEERIRSVQYYYRDANTNVMRFVFGVNLTNDDINSSTNRYNDKYVYLSCVSKRDMRVFDDLHKVKGHSVNYLDEDNEIEYGTGQYYKEDTNNGV